MKPYNVFVKKWGGQISWSLRKDAILEIALGLFLFAFFIFAIIQIKSKIYQSTSGTQITLSPSQGIELLNSKLKRLGVPIKNIDILSTSPLGIKIVMQSSSNRDSISADDQWHWFLIEREATTAYLFGFRLDSFRLVILNTNNEDISDETNFLYPSDFSQQLTTVPPSSLDDEAVKGLLEKDLVLNQLKIVHFQVSSGNIVRDNTKFVEFLLSYPSYTNSADMKNNVNHFLNSFFSNISRGDLIKRANISLVRILIKDSNGKILLHIMDDWDTQMHSRAAIEGIDYDWFPRPPLPDAFLSAIAYTVTPIMTDVPGRKEVYPPPERTSTATPNPNTYP